MAVVAQTITPTPVVQVFAGIPRGSNNIYPRARVTFTSAVAITLKAAGNTNTVNYHFNLPANYAYRIDQSYVAIGLETSTEISQFEDLGLASLSLNNGSSFILRMPLVSAGVITTANVAGRIRLWNLEDVFGEVFQATSSNVRLLYELFDNDGVNETVAMGSQVHVSFLQYDIQQIINVGVNAPQPVNVV